MNIFNHSLKEFLLSRLACEESQHQTCVLNSLFFLKMKSNMDRNSDSFFPIHVLVPENDLHAETTCLLANQRRAVCSGGTCFTHSPLQTTDLFCSGPWLPTTQQRVHCKQHGPGLVCSSPNTGRWQMTECCQQGAGCRVWSEGRTSFSMSQTRRPDATLQSTGSGNLDTLLYCHNWSFRSHLNPDFLKTNLCGLLLPPVPSGGPAKLFTHFKLEP